MLVEQPLILQELTVAPSDEWSPQFRGWIVVRIAEGAGYCLRAEMTRELNCGDGLVSPCGARVLIRASQLGWLRLQFVQIQPELLKGLLTIAECHQLESAADNPACVSFFKAEEPMGQKFARLAGKSGGEKLAVRCAMLQLWANCVADLCAAPALPPAEDQKLRRRFRKLLEQMPEARLLEFSLSDLARQLNCSERHLRRLFCEELGTPFRRHQAELRRRPV